MAWWGNGDAGEDALADVPDGLGESAFRRVVFEPEPLQAPKAKGKGAGRGKTARDAAPAKAPSPAEEDRRTPLQVQLAEITEKHRDGPVEAMVPAMRDALSAAGRDVPDDWILAIAESLREKGPTPLNFGGPGSAPR
jgi:hypothetical protein